ncbi:MAG: glutathione S-transferase N-terminal domain-containing protein [Sedimenticola sp.]|nr:glutathione S-transferase N-terminal domain-containing protein [Sedimenticola sp.]
MKKRQTRITLYSSRNCSYCRRAKSYLQQNHIPFSEQDVERNKRAQLDFMRAGGRGVPLIVIGDQAVQGFEPRQLQKALRQAGFDV